MSTEQENQAELKAIVARMQSELAEVCKRLDEPVTKAAPLHGGLFMKRDASGATIDEFQIFVPFSKVEEIGDGSLIVEAWANVSDFIDSDGEYFSPEGLQKFVESWQPTGNFRGQHDPGWVIGTINNPRIGKLNIDKPLGVWIQEHPVTKTQAIFVRWHVVDDKGIKFIKAGVMTGLSVGGEIPPGGRTFVDVEVDERGVVLREVA